MRELGQIYGSIEAQHQKTLLLDFNDQLADYDRFARADALFAKDKAISAPERHDVSPRIQAQIEAACAWFYNLYYPKGR